MYLVRLLFFFFPDSFDFWLSESKGGCGGPMVYAAGITMVCGM